MSDVDYSRQIQYGSKQICFFFPQGYYTLEGVGSMQENVKHRYIVKWMIRSVRSY